jgi:hypothetical protein
LRLRDESLDGFDNVGKGNPCKHHGESDLHRELTIALDFRKR